MPKKREQGAEETWKKMRRDGLIKATDEEFRKAKEIVARIIAQRERDGVEAGGLPLILDYRDFQAEGLSHSFVAIPQAEAPGYKIGCMARADLYQEGFLGHGAFGRVSLLQWENGLCDAIKIEPARSEEQDAEEKEILEELGYHISDFVDRRDRKESWIYSRSIKDRKITIMKRIPGDEMRNFISSPDYEELSPEERYDLAAKSVGAILNLHDRGILHSDIKPANMMLDWRGDVAVVSAVDFGFSMKLKDGNDFVERNAKGTPMYMAPEISFDTARKQGSKVKYSKASDVYALGVMLRKDLKIDEKAGSPFHVMISRMTDPDPMKRPNLSTVKSALDNVENYKQFLSCYEYLKHYGEGKALAGNDKGARKAEIANKMYEILEEYRVRSLQATHDDMFDINKEFAGKIINLMRENRKINRSGFMPVGASEFNLQVLRSLPNVLKDSVCDELGVEFDSDILAKVSSSNRAKLATALDGYEIRKKGRYVSTGIERKWIKQRENSSLKVTQDEWAYAKEQLAIKIESGARPPFKISFSEHSGSLNHDFIVMASESGIKLGCMARADAFYTKSGQRQEEGYLGHGAVGVVCMVQWENGEVDAVKVETNEADEDPTERRVMEKMGQYLATFVEEGDVEREWIRKNRPDQKIKDKKYTVMKRLPGKEFKDWLTGMNVKSTDLPLAQSLELALKSAMAIQEVHDKDIIFGDFHPGNIMLDWKGDVAAMVMVDFGTAMELKPGETSITLKPKDLPGNRPLGTRAYMAPEVGTFDRKRKDSTGDFLWLSKGCKYSKASDMYSVGELFKRLGLSRNPVGAQLIKRLQSKNPEDRPNVSDTIKIVNNLKKYAELFDYTEKLSKKKNQDGIKLYKLFSENLGNPKFKEEKIIESILEMILSTEGDYNIVINMLLKSPKDVKIAVAEKAGIPVDLLEAEKPNMKAIKDALVKYKSYVLLQKAELSVKEMQRDSGKKLAKGKKENTTISVSQALLILIDKYKTLCERQPLNGKLKEKLDKLKGLYLSGFRTAEDLNYLELLKREERDVLGNYNISAEFKVIADDPTRRYFETHLAIRTRQDLLPQTPLSFIEDHYNSMINSMGPQKPKPLSKKEKRVPAKLSRYKKQKKAYLASLDEYEQKKRERTTIQESFNAEQPVRELALEALKNELSVLQASIDDGTYSGSDSIGEIVRIKEKIKNKEDEMKAALKYAQMNQVENLVRGATSKLQLEVDKTFCGHFQDDDTDASSMYREYSDMLARVDEDKEMAEEDKKKARMLIKCGRLAALMGTRDARGRDMPGASIYREGLYAGDARGRKTAVASDEWVAHRAKGLLRGYHPLPDGDLARAERDFEYFKPSDRNTFVDPADWIQKSMGYLVHTYSNSISGTMLAQLKSMALLRKDGTLSLKTPEDIAKFARLMITTMTEQSGGHSLLEFSSPIFYGPLQDLFKDMPGFDQLTFEDVFLRGNEKAFEEALSASIKYNRTILSKQNMHNELLRNKKNTELRKYKEGWYKDPSSLLELIDIGAGNEALDHLKTLGSEGITILQDSLKYRSGKGDNILHALALGDPKLFTRFIIESGITSQYGMHRKGPLFQKNNPGKTEGDTPIDVAIFDKNYAVILSIMANPHILKNKYFITSMTKTISEHPELKDIYNAHMARVKEMKRETEQIYKLNEELLQIRGRLAISSSEDDFMKAGELAAEISSKIRNVQTLTRVVSLDCGYDDPSSQDSPYVDYVIKMRGALTALQQNKAGSDSLKAARKSYEEEGKRELFQLAPNPQQQGFILLDEESGRIKVSSPVDFAKRYADDSVATIMNEHTEAIQKILSKSKTMRDLRDRHKYSDKEIQYLKQDISERKAKLKTLSKGHSKIKAGFAKIFRFMNKSWADRVIAEESVKKRIDDDIANLDAVLTKIESEFTKAYDLRDEIHDYGDFDIQEVLSDKRPGRVITGMTMVDDVGRSDKKRRVHVRDFTHLSSDNVYQNPGLLAIVAEAYSNSGKEINLIDLVSFKPDRALLQIISAFMSAEFKLSDGSLSESNRNAKIKEIYEEIRNSREFKNLFGGLYFEIKDSITKREGDEYIDALSSALVIAKNISLPDPRYEGITTKDELAIEIATMRVYNSKMREIMGEYVLDKMTSDSERYGLEERVAEDMEVGYLCLTNRGQDSSSHVGSIVSKINEDTRGAVVLISADSYKELLVDSVSRLPSDVKSAVSNEEAELIERQVCALSKRKNMSILQMSKDTIDPNFMRYKIKVGTIVSGDTVEISRKAFEDGDSANIKMSLIAQKKMVKDVISILCDPRQFKSEHAMILNFLSDKRDVGGQAKEFMKVRSLDGERKVEILDEKLLEEFLQKQIINENAKKFSEIYPEEPELSQEIKAAKDEFYKQLKAAGLTVENKGPSLGAGIGIRAH